jgi:predicted outer membrane protein
MTGSQLFEDRKDRLGSKATTSGLLVLLALVAALASPASARSASPEDERFLARAAVGATFEIELGTLAQRIALAEEVRQFGAQIVDTYGRNLEDLRQVAGRYGVTLPPVVEGDERREQAKLADSGELFDALYTRHLVRQHRKLLERYRAAANSGRKPIQAFAHRHDDELHANLKVARDLHRRISAQHPNQTRPNHLDTDATPDAPQGGTSSPRDAQGGIAPPS